MTAARGREHIKIRFIGVLPVNLIFLFRFSLSKPRHSSMATMTDVAFTTA